MGLRHFREPSLLLNIFQFLIILVFLLNVEHRSPKDDILSLIDIYNNSNFINSSPFFTIMMPVYNKIKYLNRSFASIFCQAYTNFEVVAVDDRSSDGSAEFLDSISNSSIRVIKHSQNSGTLNTRVDAVKASRGKYLITLDPDDELICNLLDVLFPFLYSEKYDILEYQYYFYKQSGKKYRSKQPITKFILMNKTTLFQTRWPWNWSLWRKCFKRIILLKGLTFIPQKLFDLHLCDAEDAVIFYHTVVFCDLYLIIDYFGYNYYQEQKGSAGICGYSSCSNKKKMEKLALSYVIDFLKQKNITDIDKLAIPSFRKWKFW